MARIKVVAHNVRIEAACSEMNGWRRISDLKFAIGLSVALLYRFPTYG
jgi:hypothetical protein